MYIEYVLQPIYLNDVGNQFSPTVIVAPLTTGRYVRFNVNIAVEAPEGGLTSDSLVLLNQIRLVDKSRILRYWGSLSPSTMRKVDEAIKISLGLISLDPYAADQQ